MISGVFGLPGAGKSVFLAKCAHLALQGKPFSVGGHPLHYGNYDAILTNFYCSGCSKFDFNELGKVDFQNCLFLCDEISLLADSRSFKTFSDDAKFFFSQHRKGGNTFIWCSQSYDDVDKRIRNLTDHYYHIRPSHVFGDKMSTVIPIEPYFDIENGHPTTGYEFAPFLQHGHVWLPHFWHYIDSYAYITSKQLTEMKLISWDQKKDDCAESLNDSQSDQGQTAV